MIRVKQNLNRKDIDMSNLETITTNLRNLCTTFDKADSSVIIAASELYNGGKKGQSVTHCMVVKPADSSDREVTSALIKEVQLHRISRQVSKFPKLFKEHTPEEVIASLRQIFDTITDPAKRNKAIAKVYPAGIDKVKEVRSYTSYFTRIRNALMVVQGVERKNTKGANKPASEYLLNLLTKAKIRATKESGNNTDWQEIAKKLQDIIKQIKDMS